MKRLYRLLALAACFLVAAPAAAQFNNVGTSAANFLKIPVGPRAAGVGGAYTALSNDVTSLYWNVAGITGVPRNEVAFTTNLWLLDLRHDYLGAVFSVGQYNRVGLSVSYLSYGDDMKETTPAQPRGTGLEFSAYDLAVGLAFARQLTDRFAFGGQVKFVQGSIAQSTTSGAAFDLGMVFASEWNNLRIGAAISNFGPDLRMSGDDLRVTTDPYPGAGGTPTDVPLLLETEGFSLPIQFQVGAAITPLQTESVSFTSMLDVRDARDFNQEVRIGGELGFMDVFYLRAGANAFLIEGSIFGGDDVVVPGQGEDPNDLVGETGYQNPTEITRSDATAGQALYNLGAGLRYTLPGTGYGFRFDYAFSKVDVLDDVHRMGVSLQF